MGNSNSGQAVITHAPPLWTQSLPRDAHKHKKYGAVPGTKVLPERIPGQRLKPTQNGRNLQEQGTISPRKISELHLPRPDYCSPPTTNHCATILQHPPNVPYSSQSTQDHRVQSKSYLSEPDLRGTSPTSHMSLPVQNMPSQGFEENRSKEKLKSKKRYKAPGPPQNLQPSISLPLERPDYPLSHAMNDSSSSISSPAKYSDKLKKRGLFRKKCDSRMSNYDDNVSVAESNSKYDGKNKNKPTTPVLLRSRSRKEIREKAKSLDNLQHELQRSQDITTSLNSLEMIELSENHIKSIAKTTHSRTDLDQSKNESYNVKRSTSIENDRVLILHDGIGKNKIIPIVQEKVNGHKKISRDSYVEDILSSPVGDPKRFEILHSHHNVDYRPTSPFVNNKEEIKDEWDEAEEEWLEKKKRGQELQNEISNAVKNLKKTSFKSKSDRSAINSNNKNDLEANKASCPTATKSFFFGMEPVNSDELNSPIKKTALAKLKEEGSAVKTSNAKHSQNIENSSISDIPMKKSTHNVSKEYRRSSSHDSTDNKIHISKKIEEFAVTVEKEKFKNHPDDFSNSITRKSDGGYHSRQNSGSFHLESEMTSDEDNQIKMNIRPILPRRQLELPRFSPNAAWRLLGSESSSQKKDIRNENSLSDDVFSVNEDHIFRYTRPIAPPRSSNEKSADSGISGDAGSPGPMHELDSVNIDKNKRSFDPLAVSSPIASGRLETKRTWIPAQDLDENSLEENTDSAHKHSVYEITTLPKLTSRSNMFSNTYSLSSKQDNQIYKDKSMEQDSSGDDHFDRRFESNPTNSDQDSPSDLNEEKDNNFMGSDSWRENWSLSRSTPNSLNYDETNYDAEKMKLKKTKAGRSIPSSDTNIEPLDYSLQQGHVMYLPEYKSFHMGYFDQNKRNENINQVQNEIERPPLSANRFVASNGNKKQKKFTYQSTVRILEKKMIEEKLSREVEEEERRRLKEAQSMTKVEEEFQKKREKEKRRLKKQLNSMQQEISSPNNSTDIARVNSSSRSTGRENENNTSSYFNHKQMPSMSVSSATRLSTPAYQSLPLEVSNGAPSAYDRSRVTRSGSPIHKASVKNWVRGRRESRSGYQSDASSTTMASSSRMDSEGVSASSPMGRKTGDIRQEIISASKNRNAGSNSTSPAPSALSKGSSRLRMSTPQSKTTSSGESRRSTSIDACHRTRELPEMRQEHRQYREYRQSERGSFMSHFFGYVKPAHKAASAQHNYRRDFCVGSPSRPNFHNGPSKEHDRHFSEVRKIKGERARKFHSTEFLDSESEPGGHGRRPFPMNYKSAHITPFKQPKGYQPVPFNGQQGKIVSVT